MKTMLALFFFAALILSGCSNDKSRDMKGREGATVQVRIFDARRGSATGEINIPGTVASRNRAEVSARVQARVEKIVAGLGSKVSRGDILAVLDDRDLAAQVAQAEAVVDQISLEYSRYESLLATGAATKQEFDAIKARKGVAEANLSLAKTMLSYANVLSPFEGVVTSRTTDVGDMALPGAPLFVIEQTSALFFDASLPEDVARSISTNDSVKVILGKGESVQWGIVAELSPNLDPSSRSRKVRVLLSGMSQASAGQYGHLLLPLSGQVSVSIPVQGVHYRGQLELVYVVDESQHASLRMVRTGRKSRGSVEILSGISENDKVIVEAPNSLTEGDSVTIEL